MADEKLSLAVQEIIRSLQNFQKKLKEDKPIDFVEVRQEETPDGPMHVRAKKKEKV